MLPALILFAHGARDPQWAAPFERILVQVRDRSPASDPLLAYLEFMQPDLAAAIAQLVARGHGAVRIVPLFLGPGGHLRNELPRLVDAARRVHPELSIDVLPPAGEDPGVIAALAAYAVR
jgi:sirohydrochlorin cobaltochelatase